MSRCVHTASEAIAPPTEASRNASPSCIGVFDDFADYKRCRDPEQMYPVTRRSKRRARAVIHCIYVRFFRTELMVHREQ